MPFFQGLPLGDRQFGGVFADVVVITVTNRARSRRRCSETNHRAHPQLNLDGLDARLIASRAAT